MFGTTAFDCHVEPKLTTKDLRKYQAIRLKVRRLCKTTEIFVKKKYVFFNLIFIPTHLGFGL